MRFANWLVERRKALHLTQGELAKRAGLSTSYISTLERDAPHNITGARPRPTPEAVVAIAKALNENPDDVLLRCGYSPFSDPENEPQSLPELLKRLRSLKVDELSFTFDENDPLHTSVSKDDYEDLLERLHSTIQITLDRIRRRGGSMVLVGCLIVLTGVVMVRAATAGNNGRARNGLHFAGVCSGIMYHRSKMAKEHKKNELVERSYFRTM